MANFSTNDLLRVIAGSVARPGDSDLDLVKRVAATEGVSCSPVDSFNDVLRRMAYARGVGPKPDDSVNWLLRRLVGSLARPGYTDWDLLFVWSNNPHNAHRTADGSWTADSDRISADSL